MSLDACADLVARADPDRFLAVMAAPPAARPRLLPIYAANVEISRAPWVTSEPMIAEMRLQWWRDALDEIAGGRAPRAHEVVTPLAEVLDAEGARLLDAAAAARRWEVWRDPFEDRAALEAYVEATAAGLMWAAARALGAGPEAEGAVRDFGWGAGLAAFLRAAPELEARGRRPLPDPSPEAVRALAETGLARIARARAARGQVPAGATPALRAGWQGLAILRQVAKYPERVASGSLGLSEFTRRARLMGASFSGRW